MAPRSLPGSLRGPPGDPKTAPRGAKSAQEEPRAPQEPFPSGLGGLLARTPGPQKTPQCHFACLARAKPAKTSIILRLRPCRRPHDGPKRRSPDSGSIQNRATILPKEVPGGPKMASWSPLGGSWAPGRPQVAAKVTLRPSLGGSWDSLGGCWGRLGASIASLGVLLGLQGGTPGAPWRLPGGAPGGHLGRYF